MRLWDKPWSEQIAKEAVGLSGLVEFENAEAILTRSGQRAISETSLGRRRATWGEPLQTVETQQRATASAPPPRSTVVPRDVCVNQTLGVAMDGVMVPVRAEGWKELKAGCVFEIERRPPWDKRSGEPLALAHAVRNRYVTHLGGTQVFGQQLWVEASARPWTQARDTIAWGDGAPWVWNLVSAHFHDSRQAGDWYQATSHLSPASQVWPGEGRAEAKRCYHQQETTWFQGQAARWAQPLPAAAATPPPAAEGWRRAVGYFRVNQRRMQYMELRADGFPMGSGMVESGGKRFRVRFTGSGMRWSRPGLERLRPIRAALLSRRFDQASSAADTSPPN